MGWIFGNGLGQGPRADVGPSDSDAMRSGGLTIDPGRLPPWQPYGLEAPNSDDEAPAPTARHPGFFARGGLGTRVFNGLGSFAEAYLALGGDRAALEALDEQEQERAAERAVALRERSLRGQASGIAFATGPVTPAVPPGFLAPWGGER